MSGIDGNTDVGRTILFINSNVIFSVTLKTESKKDRDRESKRVRESETQRDLVRIPPGISPLTPENGCRYTLSNLRLGGRVSSEV